MRGRIRTIKPEAFSDERLWDLEQETGLPIFRGFVGLWTQADREGRFEWRPRALKASILPYWDGDFSRVLDALTTRGFVVKYACDGREFGAVRTFSAHQVVNNREEASRLPEPPKHSMTLTCAPRVDDACSTPLVQDQEERKGTEGNGRERKESDARAALSDPDPEPEGWLRAWRLYVETCCSGIAPGEAYRHQALCASLWEAGARQTPKDPSTGVRAYLGHRRKLAAASGKPVPALRWLVQDLPGWLEEQNRAVPASAPRKRDEMAERARAEFAATFEPPPAELKTLIASVGRKL